MECALKSLILHDRSFDPATAMHDPTILAREHGALSRKPYGHDLVRLLAVTITAHGAPYVPDVPPTATVRKTPWKETIRYAPHGKIGEATARAYHEWACAIYEQTVLRMKLDGVI